MTVPRTVELAACIAAATVSDYLAANNVPQRSFDINAPLHGVVPNDTFEIETLRQLVLAYTAKLSELLLGPREYPHQCCRDCKSPVQCLTSDPMLCVCAYIKGLEPQDYVLLP